MNEGESAGSGSASGSGSGSGQGQGSDSGSGSGQEQGSGSGSGSGQGQGSGSGSAPGAFDLAKMVQAAQQVKAKLEDIQQQLTRLTVEADAGGGMVTVTANCAGEIVNVKIDPAVVDPAELDMLQDLITAACNLALKKGRDRAKEQMQEEVARVAGVFPLPGIFG